MRGPFLKYSAESSTQIRAMSNPHSECDSRALAGMRLAWHTRMHISAEDATKRPNHPGFPCPGFIPDLTCFEQLGSGLQFCRYTR